MRIVYDASYIQKHRAGHGRYAIELLRALLASDTKDEFVLHGWSYGLDRKELAGLSAKNVTFRMARIPGFVKRRYWNRYRIVDIAAIVGRAEVFHSTDAFLPKLGKIKGIATVHDLCQKRNPEFFERGVLRWDKYIERSLSTASAIVVPSGQTWADLLEMYPQTRDRVHRIHYPIDHRFCPHPNDDIDRQVRRRYGLDYPFLLYVGTVEPRKNLIRLIQAFDRLPRTGAFATHLVMAGKPGWMYSDIFRAMFSAKERGRIHYLEYVPEEDLPSLYRLARLFVYPSLYEGFGYPVAEAMASGTPVVTSDTSALREIGEGAAMLVNPLDVDSIAAAMDALLRDEAQCRQCAAAGRARAKSFSHAVAAREVLELYRALSESTAS